LVCEYTGDGWTDQATQQRLFPFNANYSDRAGLQRLIRTLSDDM